MRSRTRRLLAATAILALAGPTAQAQETGEKAKELEVLGQFVGDWTTEVTSKPAIWTPKEIKFRTTNHAEFVLDGWFLQHIEVNHVVGDPDKVTKSLFIWTFDPKIKKFVGWTFQSSGNITKAIGMGPGRSRISSNFTFNVRSVSAQLFSSEAVKTKGEIFTVFLRSLTIDIERGRI